MTWLLALQQQAQYADPTVAKIGGVLIASVVAQIVVGVIFMVGFVAIVRRSIDKDIPAKLQSIDQHIADLGSELRQMRRDVDGHGYRLQNLEERRRDDLDDTRSRMRRPPNSPR